MRHSPLLLLLFTTNWRQETSMYQATSIMAMWYYWKQRPTASMEKALGETTSFQRLVQKGTRINRWKSNSLVLQMWVSCSSSPTTSRPLKAAQAMCCCQFCKCFPWPVAAAVQNLVCQIMGMSWLVLNGEKREERSYKPSFDLLFSGIGKKSRKQKPKGL